VSESDNGIETRKTSANGMVTIDRTDLTDSGAIQKGGRVGSTGRYQNTQPTNTSTLKYIK
jgi:hypothetical protein